MRWARLGRRVIRHHLVLALATGVCFAVVGWTLPRSTWAARISLATAYASLAFLATTLVLGPLNVLQARPNAVSTDLRRDIGIWAAVVGLTHVVFGLQVHMSGDIWRYFMYGIGDRPWLRLPVPVRLDLFGFANYTGLAATLILVLLLGLSNDRMLRTLGPRRWKKLQRWNYALLVLGALHTAAYQVLEKRALAGVLTAAAMIAGALLIQLHAYRRRRRAVVMARP